MKMSPLPYSPTFLSIESFVNLYILLYSHVLKKSNFPPSKAFESHFNWLQVAFCTGSGFILFSFGRGRLWVKLNILKLAFKVIKVIHIHDKKITQHKGMKWKLKVPQFLPESFCLKKVCVRAYSYAKEMLFSVVFSHLPLFNYFFLATFPQEYSKCTHFLKDLCSIPFYGFIIIYLTVLLVLRIF